MIQKHIKVAQHFSFEILLFALIMVLFNKIFVPDQSVYVQYIWPANMFILGISSILFYKHSSTVFKAIFFLLFIGVFLIPFNGELIFSTKKYSLVALLIYILFFLQLFIEVVRQITDKNEITIAVILGSVCGFLLLILVATFSFLLLENRIPNSFGSNMGESVPDVYIQFTYFSMITLSTIGYGDITPQNDSAKLLASFFGIVGQFYMVALVGIIISKFTSKN